MKITFKEGCGPVTFGEFAVANIPKILKKEKKENNKFAMNSEVSYKSTNLSLSNHFSEVKAKTTTQSTTSGEVTKQQASKKTHKNKKIRKRGGKKNTPEVPTKAANPATHPVEVASKKSLTVAKSTKVSAKADCKVLSLITTLPAKDTPKSRSKTFAEVVDLQRKKKKPVAQRQVHKTAEPHQGPELSPKLKLEEPPKNSTKVEKKKKVTFQEPSKTWAQVLASTVSKKVAKPTLKSEELRKFEDRIPSKVLNSSSVKAQMKGSPKAESKVVAINTKQLVEEQKMAAKTVGQANNSEADEAARKESATAVLDATSIEIVRLLKTIQENPDLDREQIRTNKSLCAASYELKMLMSNGMDTVEFVDVAKSNKGINPRKAQEPLPSSSLQPKEQIPIISPVARPVVPRVSQVPAKNPVKETPKLWSQILATVKTQKMSTRVVPLVFQKLPIKEKTFSTETQEKDKMLAQTMTKPSWKNARTPTTKTVVPPKSLKKIRQKGQLEPKDNKVPETYSDSFQMVKG